VIISDYSELVFGRPWIQFLVSRLAAVTFFLPLNYHFYILHDITECCYHTFLPQLSVPHVDTILAVTRGY